jgi:hypothetical protein
MKKPDFCSNYKIDAAFTKLLCAVLIQSFILNISIKPALNYQLTLRALHALILSYANAVCLLFHFKVIDRVGPLCFKQQTQSNWVYSMPNFNECNQSTLWFMKTTTKIVFVYCAYMVIA